MKSGVLLPPNSYIDYFDFALVFDLPYSKIHISLSPSIIKDPSGITGVKAEIKHFKKTIFAEQYIYTSPNFSDSVFFTASQSWIIAHVGCLPGHINPCAYRWARI
jgi:hypothetical protein